MQSQNRISKLKHIGFVLAIYVGLSLLFVAFMQDNGTLPAWLFQAVIGPLWHLANSFVFFEHVDVVDLSNKGFITGLISIAIWVVSGMLIALWFWVEKKSLKVCLIAVLVAIWLVVGYFNIFLYGLATV